MESPTHKDRNGLMAVLRPVFVRMQRLDITDVMTGTGFLTLFPLNLYSLYPLMPRFDNSSISLMTTFDALFILQ